jgi:DNA-binding transcriptional ArsR family regulator
MLNILKYEYIESGIAHMPNRAVAAKELANIFKVLSHQDRIRIVEELRDGEKDVNTLCQLFELSPSRVSQHLSLMRAHRLIEERREGRHVFYHLVQPDIAKWIVDGLVFLEDRLKTEGISQSAIEKARELWTADQKK